MSYNVEFQAYFFLISVLWGSAILIIYDIIRILRRIIKHSIFFIALEDILFWIISSFLIFTMIYRQNDGVIRGFAILGMLIGMVIYNVTISKYLVTYISNIVNKLLQLIISLINYIMKPIKGFIKIVLRMIRKLWKTLKKITKKIIKRLKKFKKTVKMILTKK